MAETAAQIGRAAHLPEQPADRFGTLRRIGGQEGTEFLGEVKQDRT